MKITPDQIIDILQKQVSGYQKQVVSDNHNVANCARERIIALLQLELDIMFLDKEI